ncbi:Protein transport protein Sec61 subunit beta [Grifola frondosa]|uniref:Protein transport protein Sec61 subunit beta n=1 Tax=Grifola frondosa TaxID=5627 RepID=A0A1C7MNK3_GRIFR|nr:Protein transport protein Sec61 subunit beta [Grifola frondosa]
MSDSETSRANGRPSSASAVAKPPGAQIRRRAAGTQASRPNSTRAAGAGGSSNTMLKLYTDDSPGLRVDPFIVLVLSLSFIASIFFLHISAKIIRAFTK